MTFHFARGRVVGASIGRRVPYVSALYGRKLLAFLTYAEQCGIALRAPLANRGAAVHDLLSATHHRLPAPIVAAAFDVIAEETPPDFALKMGARWTFLEFGLTGFGLLRCRTYGEFSDHWINHIDYIGLPIEVRSVIDNNQWSLEMRPRIPLSPRATRLCIEEACSSVFPIHAEICGTILEGARVEFTDPPSPRDAVCERTLGVPVRSGAATNRLVMRLSERFTSIRVDETMLQRFCADNCAAILPDCHEAGEVARRVRERLLLSRGQVPSLADTARSLGISKRTANRRLADGGTSYAGLVAQYRSDYAAALLRTGELTIKQVSFMLGYDDTGSFRRAFRRWRGRSVRSWMRAELRAPAHPA